MTDTLNQGTETGEAGEGTENGNIRLLREKAQKADDLQVQLDNIQRERGIEKSGVDTATPLGKFFLDNFKGDVTDIEAVKAAAKELGVPIIATAAGEATGEGAGTEGAGTGEGGEAGTGTEDNGTAERSELAGGAPADTGVNPDPREGALKTAQDALARGATEDAAMGGYLNKVAEAASNGDPRVIYNERNAR